MSIRFSEQYYVEKQRNDDFQGLIFLVGALGLIFYGLIFHWLPRILRGKREVATLKYKWVFNMMKIWDILTGCIGVNLPFRKQKCYVQPSLILLGFIYLAINAAFSYVKTVDLDYEPRFYIIGKRLGRLSVGNLPLLNILILKNDLVTSFTGLQHDRIEVMHHWLGRLIWTMVTVHLSLTITYWVGLDFEVMIFIPPQIFGMIAYATMFFLTWASMRFIRKWSYDFFLVQHKVLAIIMLLFVFFHNPSSKAGVLIAVHIVVLDRVISRIIGVIHRRTSPTKGISDFKLLDEDTLEVNIEIKTLLNPNKWYSKILPKVGNWNVGQHVYLNVSKVSLFQFHPFTISSTPESGAIKLIIRRRNGFTKRLIKKIEALQQDEELAADFVQLKVSLWGPYGGKIQPLLNFDSVLFFSAGSGSSFTFPLALDLLQTIRQRNEAGDYFHRPEKAFIQIVWVIRDIQNINWFRDILNQLSKYIEDGTVRIDVYVTQSQPNKLICHETVEHDSTKEVSTKEIVRDLEDTASSSASDSEYESTIFDLTNIEVHYARPKASSLIKNSVDELITEDKAGCFKSLAVISCGPSSLTDSTKEECQRNRQRKHSPDIYCFTENYS